MKNGARPKNHRERSYGTKNPSTETERKQHKLHKDLIEFDDFQSTILPALRKDVKSGMTPKQLQEKYAALAAARMINIALTDENITAASAASKDILDRVSGKATEKKEVTHKFKDLTDSELDAILESEEALTAEMESKFEN